MFKDFGKIPRLLNMPMVVTEKIDGTNAQVYIEHESALEENDNQYVINRIDGLCILAGSRTRYIVPGSDNFGFAAFVATNVEDLIKLGPGRHFGEWWGKGIQRGYGVPDKRFSLFNVSKWSGERPLCCSVVPLLHFGQFSQSKIEEVKAELKVTGSKASPFMDPEGVVVYLPKANLLFKSTFGNDEPKGLVDTKDVTG